MWKWQIAPTSLGQLISLYLISNAEFVMRFEWMRSTQGLSLFRTSRWARTDRKTHQSYLGKKETAKAEASVYKGPLGDGQELVTGDTEMMEGCIEDSRWRNEIAEAARDRGKLRRFRPGVIDWKWTHQYQLCREEKTKRHKGKKQQGVRIVKNWVPLGSGMPGTWTL